MRLIDADALIKSIEEIYCKPCKEHGNPCRIANGTKCIHPKRIQSGNRCIV